jgi:hypothetical protein
MGRRRRGSLGHTISDGIFERQAQLIAWCVAAIVATHTAIDVLENRTAFGTIASRLGSRRIVHVRALRLEASHRCDPFPPYNVPVV